MEQDVRLRILLCDEPEYGSHFRKAFYHLRGKDCVMRYFAEPQNLLAQATLYEVDAVLVNEKYNITQNDMPEGTELFWLSDNPKASGREIFKYQSVEEILKIVQNRFTVSEVENAE